MTIHTFAEEELRLETSSKGIKAPKFFSVGVLYKFVDTIDIVLDAGTKIFARWR